MAAGRLAIRLADELGVTASKAARFVDDAGEATAKGLLDDVASKGGRTLPDGWWKPVAGAGGLTGAAGGTALLWRQQDVWKAREAAEAADSYDETVRKIIESDLPGEIKLSLAQGAADQAAGAGGSGAEDDDGLLGQDTQTTLVLLIVAVIVLVYGLNTVGGE